VKRGTFSHRHAAVFDQESGDEWCALRHLRGAKGRFEIFNSPLTECACVGFEYGYSLVDPRALVIWEAQFGDFANGAQVMFDQFMAAAEAKWFRSSALTLLLPHGYEGQGPEHSSARMERFLQLAAEDNIQVVYPSTTAQVFHVLRRQMRRSFRKPLVVMTPKSMLRLPAAQSPLPEFAHGHFQAVIGDPAKPDASKVKRVVFCTGKLFHELDAARRESGAAGVALVRIEQLTPFPAEEVRAQLARYRGAEAVWAQEEPENMGAWQSMLQQFVRLTGKAPTYAGRPAQASPAVGSLKRHGKEQAKVVALALGAPAEDHAPAAKDRGEKAR
jgi:2-oxoglutarate dehydrogenase E1 component